jgi:hypothetical protein
MKHLLNMKRQLKLNKLKNHSGVSLSLTNKKQNICLISSTEKLNRFNALQVQPLKYKITIKQIKVLEIATLISLKGIRQAIKNKFRAINHLKQQLSKQQLLQDLLLRQFQSGRVTLIFNTLLLQVLLVPRLCNIITIKLLCLLLKLKDRN